MPFANPYLATMARKLLLTLIAVLTGLSWQGSGVQARAMPVTAQVAAVSALATVQQAKAFAVAARPVATPPDPAGSLRISKSLHMPVPALAGARTGIDRAHE